MKQNRTLEINFFCLYLVSYTSQKNATFKIIRFALEFLWYKYFMKNKFVEKWCFCWYMCSDLCADCYYLVSRKENSDLKNTIQSRDDVILGLRRDLAGAHARLSDITGTHCNTKIQEYIEGHMSSHVIKLRMVKQIEFRESNSLLETKNWYSILWITGELSESQKQEMEKHKEKLVQREREIEGLRLQMAKLSKIIDKQKDEIKSLQKQLRLVYDDTV